MKLKMGSVSTLDKAKSAEIVLKRSIPSGLPEFIGGTLCIAAGVTAIMRGAYKNGAFDYEAAEYAAEEAIGALFD